MADYTKISDMTAASALDGTELIETVQSSNQRKATVAQVAASTPMVEGFQALSAGIANTVQITGEHMFTADNELDYTSSIINGMAAATVTFTELPATTVAILVSVMLRETTVDVALHWKRASGDTQEYQIRATFADQGSNRFKGTYWMPTSDNSIYVTMVSSDTELEFKIIGYKTGA